jgi:hypothetical protein
MSNALKATLLSGLVFPGLGQLVLKHYLRAAVWMSGVVVSLIVITNSAMQQANTIVEQLERQGGILDLNAITAAANQAAASGTSPAIGAAGLALLACWVCGMLDAYWVGRKADAKGR